MTVSQKACHNPIWTGDIDSGFKLPATLDEAVELLIKIIPDRDKKRIFFEVQKSGPTILHLSLGMWVRNIFGMWGKNHTLLRNIGSCDPDYASGIILDAFFDRLNRQ